MIPLLLAAILATPAPTTIAAMKWHHRVLIVAAPAAEAPALAEQRRLLSDWRTEAAARDLVIVEVIGGRVSGATDPAPALRRRYRLPTDGFATILIGKDGGVKLRSATPLAPATLTDTIDSMPMRQAGER